MYSNEAKSLIGLISHYKLIWVVGCVIRQMLRYLLLKSIDQITRLKKKFSHPHISTLAGLTHATPYLLQIIWKDMY